VATFYLAVFVIGFALTAISFLMGVAGHSPGHLGDLFHGGDGGHAGGHGGDGGHGLKMPAINFATLTAFMTWFGGIGYLMSSYSKLVAVAVVILAGLGGLAGAGIIFVFMAKVLAPDQIPLDPADYYMPGTLGRVTVTIPEHGTGEIVYTQAGTRKTVAARAADGAGIAKGTEVVVLRYERGIVYARPWEHVAGERQGRGDA
jgi:membrane protein implicated in regulation of membrane protease activity